MSEVHDPYAALRIGDYRCLFAGSVLSNLGLGALTMVVGWEMYERTRSALMLGYTGLAQFLPVLLLSLVAGQVADRFSRRLVVQLAQSTIGLAAVGLALLSAAQGPIELIFVCLVLVGTGRTFSMPARASLVPQLVPADVLPNAITWSTSGFQISNIAGPAVGGILIAWTGKASPAYALTATCCLVCVLLLIPVRPRETVRTAGARTLESLLAGVRFVFRSELLFAAITLDLFAVLLGGATALLPVFAASILDVGAVGLSWLRSAPALGALLMGLFLAHRAPMKRAGLAMLMSVYGFGAATIVFGGSKVYLLSFAMLLLAGALDNISVVVRHTLVQILTPDEMRGRVAAVNTVFISSSNELGEFESGLTAHWVGPMGSVVGGGAGTILVVLFAMYRWPALLRLKKLHEMSPERAQ